MNEKELGFISAEQKYLHEPDSGMNDAAQFLSDPESFIVSLLDEIPTGNPIEQIGHVASAISDTIDTIVYVDVANVADEDIAVILQYGPAQSESETALFRLFKRAGLLEADVAAWVHSLPPREDGLQGKLKDRGTLANYGKYTQSRVAMQQICERNDCCSILAVMAREIAISAVQKIHFIGIGGIGMSALARFFIQEKKTVTGSDAAASIVTEGLEQIGIKIVYEQSATNITDETDLFIYTEAMASDHPELVTARATGKPVINYFEALGLVANPYYLIAVAGTHGKTTTTAMITDIFEAAEKDPTAIIGSLRAKTKSNFRAGKSKYCIVEACEYKRDFLSLTPDVLVITNLEHDHVDYYQSLADVQQAFRELIDRVHETGVVITNPADPTIAPIVRDIHVPVIDYTKHLDPQLQLYAPGLHNLQNAAAALAVAAHERLSLPAAKNALEQCTGTWRRFEYKGEYNGAPVYDDYAHHPTAIAKTLVGMREKFPDRKIVAVFQPHTFTRTKALFADFAKSFRGADEMIIAPIYAAREENTVGVSSRELAVKALEYNPNTRYLDNPEEIIAALQQTLDPQSVAIVMGAGTVTAVSEQLVATAS